MHGQLYQSCEARGCSTEPVCAACFKCARHCTCDADNAAINKARAENRSALEAMLAGMVELVPTPAQIKGDQVAEKLDFSPWGGGVYKTYTPIIYTSPAELAGQYGVHYWYYIGGDDAVVTDKFWVAKPEEVAARKAAAEAWLAAKAVKDAAEKVLQQERDARWQAESAAKAVKKAAADSAKAAVIAKLSALVPKLATMTKPAILAEVSSLLNDHVIAQSWSKAKIIEAITAFVAGGCDVPRMKRRHDDDEYPDYG